MRHAFATWPKSFPGIIPQSPEGDDRIDRSDLERRSSSGYWGFRRSSPLLVPVRRSALGENLIFWIVFGGLARVCRRTVTKELEMQLHWKVQDMSGAFAGTFAAVILFAVALTFDANANAQP